MTHRQAASLAAAALAVLAALLALLTSSEDGPRPTARHHAPASTTARAAQSHPSLSPARRPAPLPPVLEAPSTPVFSVTLSACGPDPRALTGTERALLPVEWVTIVQTALDDSRQRVMGNLVMLYEQRFGEPPPPGAGAQELLARIWSTTSAAEREAALVEASEAPPAMVHAALSLGRVLHGLMYEPEAIRRDMAVRLGDAVAEDIGRSGIIQPCMVALDAP